jgi:hypothetical protein
MIASTTDAPPVNFSKHPCFATLTGFTHYIGVIGEALSRKQKKKSFLRISLKRPNQRSIDGGARSIQRNGMPRMQAIYVLENKIK